MRKMTVLLTCVLASLLFITVPLHASQTIYSGTQTVKFSGGSGK